MNPIHITISLAQGNLILEGLVERPFKQVFALIGNLNQQAGQLLPAGSPPDAKAELTFSAAELRLIIEVLGEMPYNRVHQLVQQLHSQLKLSEVRRHAG
ncbi:hypothetical protein ACO0LM_02085 [Undibacterium sp. Di26W]|uniref:hypothetical protein n=1 Tax=Undibacterium sp. Di26W TaxID=3413035 RepID=UPI003BF12987